MLEPVRRTLAFLREKQILHKLGVALSLMVIGFALHILYQMLRDIDLDDVLKALRGTEIKTVALAGLCVAAGYFTLTFYDFFALRAIGRNEIPYRIAAFAGFTSYSIGHNVGASVFTGGAVRYRIYSSWDMTAIDVAKVCFIAGLTFWLGNAAVLGIGVAYHPEAASSIDQLPIWFNRVLATLLLAILFGYVIWVSSRPRHVGRGNWTVTLPGGSLTLVQILIGIVDLSFCALAMYILMPNEPYVGFVVVAVIFVSATLLGFASHSPGGLGVFDAAMLYGIMHFDSQFDKEELLAGMLLFRLLYYITPFVISVVLLLFREVMLGAKARCEPGLRKRDDISASES